MDKVNGYFTTQTHAKISQFKILHQNIKKQSLTINEYLSKVKNTINHLASVGYVTSDTDHEEAILNGLRVNYDTLIMSVNSKSEAYTVKEIDSLLLELKRQELKNISENLIQVQTPLTWPQKETYQGNKTDEEIPMHTSKIISKTKTISKQQRSISIIQVEFWQSILKLKSWWQKKLDLKQP